MRYMLDTDVCSYLMRRQDRRLLATMQTRVRSGAHLSISAITYAELRLGAERSSDPVKHHAIVGSLCERLSGIRAWDAEAADVYARVQSALLRAGTPIGNNDAMIGAHALSVGYVLVTNNDRHFRNIEGLDIENWLDV